jgi:hypothetical protein
MADLDLVGPMTCATFQQPYKEQISDLANRYMLSREASHHRAEQNAISPKSAPERACTHFRHSALEGQLLSHLSMSGKPRKPSVITCMRVLSARIAFTAFWRRSMASTSYSGWLSHLRIIRLPDTDTHVSSTSSRLPARMPVAPCRTSRLVRAVQSRRMHLLPPAKGFICKTCNKMLGLDHRIDASCACQHSA